MDKVCNTTGVTGATTGTVIMAKACTLQGVFFTPGATSDSVTLYDNASAASGTILYIAKAVVTTAGVLQTIPAYLPNLECKNGIYAVVVSPGGAALTQIYT